MEKNITGAPAEAPIDFGRRYLQEFDLNDYFKKVNENMQKRFAQFNKEMEESFPEHAQEEETSVAEPQQSQFVKDTMDKLRPWIENMEKEQIRAKQAQEYAMTPHYEDPKGLCPLCFLLITFSAFVQACLLKKHARACARL